MSLNDFEIGKELGKGAFGSVSIVKRLEDGKTYAMKRVKISQLGTKERENALNEVRILASLSHPNIIGYKEAFFDEESRTLNVVMELADDGDLESKVQKNNKTKGFFPEKDVWSYLVQITQGLKYLHDNKILHRDLKCANIFLMKNGTLKLGDLNVSKILKMGLAHTQTGTPYYASPEVWADKPYDFKSDVWSIACVIYELCALKPPFRGNSLEQLCRNVLKGIYDPIPSMYSKDLSNIIGRMLQTNSSLRPSCDEILSNETVIKRMQAIKEGKEVIGEKQPIQLLGTIKLPRNLNEINQKLPKKKMYKQEMEEAHLMNYDVNINKKQVTPAVELPKNDKGKDPIKDLIKDPILDSKEVKGREINKNIVKEKEKYILPSNNQKVASNDNNLLYNNNNLVNNNNIIRKEIYNSNNNAAAMLRPNSVKNEIVKNQKAPIILKNDPTPNNAINNRVYNSNNNNQVKSDNNYINNNIYSNNDKAKAIINRPQSAKVDNNYNNDYNNKINQIQQLNQIARKNIISERPSSPKKNLNIPSNNYPSKQGGNSPRDKSPLRDKINIANNNNPLLRPQSGKDRNPQLINNGQLLRNDKKVVIEKINFDKPILQNPIKVMDKKLIYNYNNNINVREQLQVNNRNNFLNAVKVNENNYALNRVGINQQPQGPKIVYINKK